MAQVIHMIDSRNFTVMGEPTNIEYDIHAQNPDQGELSASAGNAAQRQQHQFYPPHSGVHDYEDDNYGGDGDLDADEYYEDADGEDDEDDNAANQFIDPSRLDQPLKLFIGQVPKSMSEDDLAFVFEPYGRILDLAVIRDRRSGNHRGCAFVTYENGEDAMKVVSEMHGKFKFEGAPWPAQVRPAAGEIDSGARGSEGDGKKTNLYYPSIFTLLTFT
jgi:hypothetical protein